MVTEVRDKTADEDYQGKMQKRRRLVFQPKGSSNVQPMSRMIENAESAVRKCPREATTSNQWAETNHLTNPPKETPRTESKHSTGLANQQEEVQPSSSQTECDKEQTIDRIKDVGLENGNPVIATEGISSHSVPTFRKEGRGKPAIEKQSMRRKGRTSSNSKTSKASKGATKGGQEDIRGWLTGGRRSPVAEDGVRHQTAVAGRLGW